MKQRPANGDAQANLAALLNRTAAPTGTLRVVPDGVSRAEFRALKKKLKREAKRLRARGEL